jgi:hypothetical protein
MTEVRIHPFPMLVMLHCWGHFSQKSYGPMPNVSRLTSDEFVFPKADARKLDGGSQSLGRNTPQNSHPNNYSLNAGSLKGTLRATVV